MPPRVVRSAEQMRIWPSIDLFSHGPHLQDIAYLTFRLEATISSA
jgi:hypothetical protein